MRKNIKATSNANPAIEPTTIPAIAPPESLLPLALAASAVGVEVGETVEDGDPDAVPDDVGVEEAEPVLVARKTSFVTVGRTTPTHFDSALEL